MNQHTALVPWKGLDMASVGKWWRQHIHVLVIVLGALSLVGCDGGSGSTPVASVDSTQAPSALSYSSNSASYDVGAVITDNIPSSTGGAVASYTVSPALPAGISLNTGTGVISGTPTAITAPTNYTVTASNSGGSATAVVSIRARSARARMA